mgnify:CR=1 FL=1
MYQSHEFYLRRCIEISKDSRAHGNAPFAPCWSIRTATS